MRDDPQCRHLPRFFVWVVLLLVTGGTGRARDLLGLSHDAASALGVEITERVTRIVITGQLDLSPLKLAAPAVAAEGSMRVVLRSPDGQSRTPAVQHRPPPPDSLHDQLRDFPQRRKLYDRMHNEPHGVGTYFSLDRDLRHVVRVDVGWSAVPGAPPGWAVAVEQERPVHSVDESPWAGRWIGAFSDTEIVLGPDGRVASVPQQAGTLSGLIYHEAARCAIRLTGSGWALSGVGVMHGDVLVVSGRLADGAPWILELTYGPEAEKLRGDLTGGSPARVLRRSVFLQRARAVD